MQVAVNFGQGHVLVVTIRRLLRGHRRRRSVFHELGVEGTAEADSGETVSYKASSASAKDVRFGQTMRSRPRNDVKPRLPFPGWSQNVKSNFRPVAGINTERVTGPGRGNSGSLVGEEEQIRGIPRRLHQGFPLYLKIRHRLARSKNVQAYWTSGIGIHFRPGWKTQHIRPRYQTGCYT